MKLVKPSFQIEDMKDGNEILKSLEYYGRNCYKSENKITNESATKFMQMIVHEKKHYSILRHEKATVRLICSRACYDKETEIYTNNGWKLFKNLSNEDTVLTRNIDGVTEFHKPVDRIEYHYTGNVHKYKSQNVDLVVTPNHKLLMKKFDVRTPVEYDLIASEDIKVNRFYIPKVMNVNTIVDEHIVIPGYSYIRNYKDDNNYVKTMPDLTFKRRDFIKLLAWYLSEGSITYNEKENKYTIIITQTDYSENNVKNKYEIAELLTNLGFTPTVNEKEIRFNSRQLGKFFKKLGKSNTKYIPWNIFELFDKQLALEFLNTYARADGSTDKTGHTCLYSTSKKLADQLQMIAFMSGVSATIWEDDRVGQNHFINGNEVKHNFICYVVSLSRSFRNMECVVKKDKHFSEAYYDDKVYCVEVPNHVIFVRRNGIAVWCGNCSHQIVRHGLSHFLQESQRYVNYSKRNDGEVQFIIPHFLLNTVPEGTYHAEREVKINAPSNGARIWLRSMFESERYYHELTKAGWKAERARGVLVNDAKTEVIMSSNLEQWRNVFTQRASSHADEAMQFLLFPMLSEFKKRIPILFDDINA